MYEMRNEAKPVVDYASLINVCRNRCRGLSADWDETKVKLLVDAGARYDELANVQKLNSIRRISARSFSRDEREHLLHLYETQVGKPTGRARNVRDEIMRRAGGRCLFCSYQKPSELDHYLPKHTYQEFSIFPPNLIPTCHECNHMKLEYTSCDENAQFVHPYFDDFDDCEWLEAHCDYSFDSEITIRYCVKEAPREISLTLLNRLKFQFDYLQLGPRYSIEAMLELGDIEDLLRGIFKKGGSGEICAEMKQRAASSTRRFKNGWKAAMYKCASDDERFCLMTWKNRRLTDSITGFGEA